MELDPKALLAAIFLVVLWTAEGLVPFFPEFPGRWRDRVRHDLRNLAFGGVNALLVAILFGGLLFLQDAWADGAGFGLLRRLSLSEPVTLVAAVVLFDLWMYLWHRANHRIPFLWRFHRMHHSDPALDVSTGVRFHPGELVLSSLARLLVLPLLGMSLWHLAVYEAILLPVILFHHSNVRFPRWVDHGLLALVVTPAMHRVHHSRWQPETDSNYGSIFPWWDRVFSSFRLREDAATIEIGLDEFPEGEWQSVRGMLRTPLAPHVTPEGEGADAPEGPAED